MESKISGRALVVLTSMLALSGALSTGCGDNTGDIGAVPVPPADDDDGPVAIIDADLPQLPNEVITDAGADQDATKGGGADAGAFTLAPNSIVTCGQYFECIQECRSTESNDCMKVCHDAMTDEAARAVHRFANCVAQNGCRNGGCIAQRCGQEAQVCFSSPY